MPVREQRPRGVPAYYPKHTAVMRQYQFQVVYLDRLELRTNGSALEQLNALGAEGWHIVHIKVDPMRERDLAVFLEREIS